MALRASCGSLDQARGHQQSTQDANLDLVGGDLQKDADRGGDGLHVVSPFNVLHTLDHEDAHHDQCRPCGKCRNRGEQGRHEDANEVKESDHECGETSTASLIHASHGFTIGGNGARAEEAAYKGTNCICHEGCIATGEGFWLLGIDEATEVCCCIKEAHGADEVDVEEREQPQSLSAGTCQ